MDGSITQLGLSNYLNTRDDKKYQTVSFFKHTYKNHTNYVKDTRELEFKNGIRFGQTSSFRFDEDGKYGDLITNIIIAIDLPDISTYRNIHGSRFGYCNGIGNAIAQNIVLRINGNIIDQHTSEWLDMYGQLTVKPGCKENYFSMIQKYSENTYTTTSFTGGRIYIPLQFWFCRNITNRNASMVLPLASLYNSTIELSLDIRKFTDLLVVNAESNGDLTGAPSLEIIGGNLLIDYIILEEEERRQYINTPKQMNIINQLQIFTFSVAAGIIETTFSLKSLKYPVTELVFVVRRNDYETYNDYFNYSNSNMTDMTNVGNPIKTVRLMFDGSDRIKTTPATVFTQLEPTKVHTNTPVNKFIHVYSFALEPEKIEQPNGLCNFSELQEPLLHLSFNTPMVGSTLYVYAINYNVLISNIGCGTLLHQLSKSVPTIFPNTC
jgi:hypothetical protein